MGAGVHVMVAANAETASGGQNYLFSRFLFSNEVVLPVCLICPTDVNGSILDAAVPVCTLGGSHLGRCSARPFAGDACLPFFSTVFTNGCVFQEYRSVEDSRRTICTSVACFADTVMVCVILFLY